MATQTRRTAILEKSGLHQLVARLLRDYEVVAPVVRDGGIVFRPIREPAEIAYGLREVAAPGEYRLEREEDGTLFAYTNGADSVKRQVHPSHLTLFSGEVTPEGFRMVEESGPERPLAFFGIRPCDLHGLQILDRVFLGGDHPDTPFHRRRQGSLVVAANCHRAGPLCFCESMGTGPRAEAGYDLVLTELPDRFLLEAGSEQGERILVELPTSPAQEGDEAAASARIEEARQQMGRRIDTAGLPELLRANPEHPVWDAMEKQCLGCTNCTMTCPTCFCYDVNDRVDVRLQHVERERTWGSCFTQQFAAVHGGNFRDALKGRYRHWVSHKLSYWVEQFDTFGCVGCGRCIVWCPVKIDITRVAASIREGNDT